MFAIITNAVRCLESAVSVLFMCRIMDQLPNHNIGSACRGYIECIGNGLKNCFAFISEKCVSCCHTEEAPPHVELGGSNANDHPEGQA